MAKAALRPRKKQQRPPETAMTMSAITAGSADGICGGTSAQMTPNPTLGVQGSYATQFTD